MNQQKLRIAQGVGIQVHGHPPGMNYFEAVREDSLALNAVVEVLSDLEDKYAMQFGKVNLGLTQPEEARSRVFSAIRIARSKLRELGREANSDMRYCVQTAGQYLDRILERVD